MFCVIYRSSKRDQTYLYVEKKDDFSRVPEELMKGFGQPQLAMILPLDGRKKLVNADIEKVKPCYPKKKFICVKGNNDFYYQENKEAYKHIDGVTIMACHGDAFRVRSTLRELINKTASVRGNLALYGHTHQRNLYSDAATGIFAVNPGAVCDGRYCVLDIAKGMFEYYPKDI